MLHKALPFITDSRSNFSQKKRLEMATKALIVLSAVFLTGLATQGAQARVLVIAYGPVPCSSDSINQTTSEVFPDASVTLVINSNISISGVTTNRKGQFLVRTNLTTEMLDSLMSNSTEMVVTTPLSACNPDLPAAGRLAAPVRPICHRTLHADKQLRDFIYSGREEELLGFLLRPSSYRAAGHSHEGNFGVILHDKGLASAQLGTQFKVHRIAPLTFSFGLT